MNGIIPAIFFLIMGLSAGIAATSNPVLETALVPMLTEEVDTFPADTASKDYFVRLPEHIIPAGGSSLTIALRASEGVAASVSNIAVLINGTDAGGISPAAAANGESNQVLKISVPVPEGALNLGWNRITLAMTPSAASRTSLKTATWSLMGNESRLKLSYEKMPLFPELIRFPESMTEEKLLRAQTNLEPTVVVLVPEEVRNPHVRALAVIGARFGQMTYFQNGDCRVSTFQNWERDAAGRNCVIVGRWDELGNLPFIPELARKLALRPGHGMLAEFVLGKHPKQYRWVVATGSDDVGLERAILTLGSRAALASLPPNPAIIDTEPLAPQAVFKETISFALKEIERRPLILRGTRSERSVSGWWIPSGHELAAGSVLKLQISHATNLTDSELQVMVNGALISRVPLDDTNASAASVEVSLPAALRSRDPMLITFRAEMESRGTNEIPWLTISGESTLEANVAPTPITGLHQVESLLVRDGQMRSTAGLIPIGSSVDELQAFLTVFMHLGNNTPNAGVLWPEGAQYGPETPVPPTRMLQRSVLVLGSVSQWRTALPPNGRLPIESPVGGSELVFIQGRRARIADFEPTLALMQMMPSPWSPGDFVVTAGGWTSFTNQSVRRIISEAGEQGLLYGNVAAIDAQGRFTGYDTRRPGLKSFAEQLRNDIPPGLSFEETRERLTAQRINAAKSARNNTRLMWIIGIFLLLLVLGRIFLVWERTQSRRKATPEEIPVTARLIWLLASLSLAPSAQAIDPRPLSAKGERASTLVIYTDTQPAFSLRDGLEDLQLQVRRIKTELRSSAISEVNPERIAEADYVIVFSPNPVSPMPEGIINALAERKTPLFWVGFGAERLQENVKFKAHFSCQPRPDSEPATGIDYGGKSWPIPVYPWIAVTFPTNSAAQVHARLSTREGSRPLCWSISNFTFFASVPNGSQINHVIGDLLLDFFGATHIAGPKVFLRIEDYHPGSSHREVQRMGDYLYAQGIPFAVAVVPWNMDDPGANSRDLGAEAEFFRGLKYLQQRGGRLFLKGVPFSETSHRLWDTGRDRPLSNEMLESLSGRVGKTAQRFLAEGLFLLAWETPEQAASRRAYKDIGQIFSTGIERVQLSDSTHNEKGVCAGITMDRHGRLLLPDNAGYVLNTPTDPIGEIRRNINFLKGLRGSLAGCSIHAYQPMQRLVQLVAVLQEAQIPFVDLADLDNAVATPTMLLLSGQAKRRVVLREALVHRKVYDRNGKLVAEETEQERRSGERLFTRDTTGDYDVIEWKD